MPRNSSIAMSLAAHEKQEASCSNCAHNAVPLQDIEDMGGAPAAATASRRVRKPARYTTADERKATARMLDALAARPENRGLPGEFFSDPAIYRADLELIFHKEWIFAGHTIEIGEAGEWLTIQVGDYPVLVMRGNDGEIRAYHNVCRHRGYKLTSGLRGQLSGKHLACPYHQWTYNIDDGSLLYAREMEDDFDATSHGLMPVHLECVSTYMFLCVAASPPDFTPMRRLLATYGEPYNFGTARVAHQSRIVEKGNWKLVWENNRECYHCEANHPELIKSFPADWIQSDAGDSGGSAAERLKLPSEFVASEDHQHRIMRHLFVEGATSMTMTGQPIGDKRFGRMPAHENVGNMPFYSYPNTWNHWQPDYALSFRVTPISPTETEVVTTYLVPGDAKEGVDYNLKELLEVWEATNLQDQHLVERVQQGVSSPAFIPGAYNKKHESGVIEFVAWYSGLMKQRLSIRQSEGVSKL